MSKVWFVTGAARGIGKEVALARLPTVTRWVIYRP